MLRENKGLDNIVILVKKKKNQHWTSLFLGTLGYIEHYLIVIGRPVKSYSTIKVPSCLPVSLFTLDFNTAGASKNCDRFVRLPITSFFFFTSGWLCYVILSMFLAIPNDEHQICIYTEWMTKHCLILGKTHGHTANESTLCLSFNLYFYPF